VRLSAVLTAARGEVGRGGRLATGRFTYVLRKLLTILVYKNLSAH
jgi:hypothetical protein